MKSGKDNLLSTPQTRAISTNIAGIDPGPFVIRSNGNTVSIYNTGLVPTYECRVYYGGMELARFNKLIESRSSYGFLDIFTHTEWNMNLGTPTDFTFSDEGRYDFYCDRMTPRALRDFSLKLMSDAFTILGIEATSDDAIENLLVDLGNYLADVDALLANPTGYIQNVLITISNWAFQKGTTLKWKNVGELLHKIDLVYNAVKGTGNGVARIIWGITAKPTVEFNLCYYNNTIGSCTEVTLEIVSGNNQTGISGEKLTLPLTVSAKIIADDDSETTLDDNQGILFEVVSGGGSIEERFVKIDPSTGTASTYWTLGENGTQEVQAVVYNTVLGKTTSNTVIFTANTKDYQIITGEAKNITATDATLSGTIIGYKTDDFMNRYGICYSTETEPTANKGTIVNSSNIQDGNFSVQLSSLAEGQTYYWRSFVKDGGEYIYGEVKSFITQKLNDDMTDRDILVAFYKATDGDNWTNNTNWCSEEPLNTWVGVQTNAEGRVTQLILNSYGLKGDANLSNLTYLEYLSLEFNALISLNVSNCTNLQHLSFHHNNVTSLNFDGCENIVQLYAYDNALTALDLSGHVNLEVLNCSYNNSISSLNINGCISLGDLSCGFNKLTELNLKGFTKLHSLEVNNNQLTSLDVSDSKQLSTLFCNRNQLTNLNITGCNELVTIDCYSNQLTSLDIKGKSKLTRLICNDNKLSSIDVREHSQLTAFTCSNNLLTSLDISSLVNISSLSCAGNQLTTLDASMCTGMNYALDCSDNLLTELKIPDCLKYLTCSKNNNLTALDLSGYANLQSIECKEGNIQVLRAVGCTALTQFILESNKCTVEELNLKDCNKLSNFGVNNTLVKTVYLPASKATLQSQFKKWEWSESENRYLYPQFR